MPENLFTTPHRTTNPDYRDNYDQTFKKPKNLSSEDVETIGKFPGRLIFRRENTQPETNEERRQNNPLSGYALNCG